MIRTTYNPWLTRFAWLTAAATLVLISVGGLVTSHEAGMSVPDWPNSYGYNMFFFPVSKWVGGIFYEHTHRLVASGVGLLTTVLAAWLWVKESRPWMRWLGVVAFVSVVVQGVLGGLRVTLLKDELGIFHAAIAQLFFCLTVAIALFSGRWWQSLRAGLAPDRRLSRSLWLTVGIILGQLILGATMRHQHAGLAIPDFPLAYGRWWPAMDPQAVSTYNQNRMETGGEAPVTPFQVGLQMIHRLVALAIVVLVSSIAWLARSRPGSSGILARGTTVWWVLIVVQAGLGAATIWTGKSADVATAHVTVGALSLATGIWLALTASRLRRLAASRIGGKNRATQPHSISPRSFLPEAS